MQHHWTPQHHSSVQLLTLDVRWHCKRHRDYIVKYLRKGKVKTQTAFKYAVFSFKWTSGFFSLERFNYQNNYKNQIKHD